MRVSELRRNVRDAALTLSDSVYVRRARSKPLDSGGLLLIRLDGIGDFFLWLRSVRSLCEAYEGGHVTLVTDGPLGDYAASTRLFDEVVSISRSRFTNDLKYRYTILDRIRNRFYDVTILPCYSRTRRFSDGEAIVRLARSRRKIGMNGAPSSTWQARLDRRWYTELVPTNDGPVHELHRNDELLTWLGVERRSTIVPAPAVAVAATPFAEEAYYVLIPGAGYPIRRWPVRQFASLAERISSATGWKCVICGGPEDEVIGREIGLYSSVEICNYAGRSSIAELVEIIRGARLVVGNETGAIHIAAAVSTPAVSVTGGGHFGRFVPYPEDMAGPVVATRHMPCFHCDWNCVYPLGAADAAPCVAGISVDAVWTRVERALAAPIGETIMKPGDGDSGDVRNY